MTSFWAERWMYGGGHVSLWPSGSTCWLRRMWHKSARFRGEDAAFFAARASCPGVEAGF